MTKGEDDAFRRACVVWITGQELWVNTNGPRVLGVSQSQDVNTSGLTPKPGYFPCTLLFLMFQRLLNVIN